MKKFFFAVFVLLCACGRPETLSETASAGAWLKNLIVNCQSQNGLKIGCSVADNVQLAPAQAVLSEFVIEYWYVNAGSSAALAFSVGMQGGAPQMIDVPLTSGDYQVQTANPQAIVIAPSRLKQVIGYGPVTAKSLNPSVLAATHLSGNAALVVKSVTVKPHINASIIAQELKALGAESDPWLSLHARTFAYHGGYINNQDVTLCNLQTSVQRFYDMFSVSDIDSVRSAGGLAAKKFLEDATRASADAGAFTIGLDTPYDFLKANWKGGLQLESKGKAACLTDATADARIPSEAACGTNIKCKENVTEFYRSKDNLIRIRNRATVLYDKAREIQAGIENADWYKIILSLKLN